uniref:Uncharacterized protein n=1 Tax=Opuntia streptacantha TaxID=393608 RepID=A0A7C9E1E1_OPUST
MSYTPGNLLPRSLLPQPRVLGRIRAWPWATSDPTCPPRYNVGECHHHSRRLPAGPTTIFVMMRPTDLLGGAVHVAFSLVIATVIGFSVARVLPWIRHLYQTHV